MKETARSKDPTAAFAVWHNSRATRVISEPSSNRRKLSVTCCSARDFICSFVIHTLHGPITRFISISFRLQIDERDVRYVESTRELLYFAIRVSECVPASVVHLVSSRLCFATFYDGYLSGYNEACSFYQETRRRIPNTKHVEIPTMYVETGERGFTVYGDPLAKGTIVRMTRHNC